MVIVVIHPYPKCQKDMAHLKVSKAPGSKAAKRVYR
jgi:hypothetical protein